MHCENSIKERIGTGRELSRKDLDAEELLKYLGIMIMTGINRKSKYKMRRNQIASNQIAR